MMGLMLVVLSGDPLVGNLVDLTAAYSAENLVEQRDD